MKKTAFITELEQFVATASQKCTLEIGEQLKEKSINLEQLKIIDYMRYAEFSAIGDRMALESGQRILDVSSPQWFTIFLAHKYPHVHFDYINIIEVELEAYRMICDVCKITNIQYHLEDVRSLSFDDNIFDKVITISVLEHIYPEQDGDSQALTEIKRVLKPEGKVFLTIPYKAERNIVYIEGSVYEREGQGKTFFAREYDREMFDRLIKDTGFIPIDLAYICERTGILSIDYYQWGPGKILWYAKYITRLKQLLETIVGQPIDEMLAQRYLHISDRIIDRVVNVAAILENN